MWRTLAAMLVVLEICGFGYAQNQREMAVIVLVLDYRSGHPVAGRPVALSLAAEIRKTDNWLIKKTDRNGVASFRIKVPPPEIFRVDPEAGSWAEWSCTQSYLGADFSGALELATSEVLNRGVVGDITHHPLCQPHVSSRPTAKPGIIVVYTRHLNPWLRFRRIMHETLSG